MAEEASTGMTPMQTWYINSTDHVCTAPRSSAALARRLLCQGRVHWTHLKSHEEVIADCLERTRDSVHRLPTRVVASLPKAQQ